MYDMSKIKTRYFTMKLKNGRILDLEPPKLKVLRKLTELSSVKDNENISKEEMSNLIEAVAMAGSKNKQGYILSFEKAEDLFDIDEAVDFLNNYFEWVNETKNQKN